jgi:copper chaperone CopZ
MKRTLLAPAVLSMMLFMGACGGEADGSAPERAAPSVGVAGSGAAATAELARVDFAVEGMTCGGCAVGTRAALEKLDGVEDADASYEESSAWALYDPARVTPERIMEAIRELGYTPTVVEIESNTE